MLPFLNKNDFLVNCEIHGNNIPGLLNGKCEACATTEQEKKHNTLYQQEFINYQVQVGIPLLFINSTFDNYKPLTTKATELLDTMRNHDQNSNIVLCGKTATGKTHLACALLNRNLNKSAKYTTFYKLNDLKIRQPEKFEKLLTCKFLVIDECGISITDAANHLLFHIINERYNNMLYTMLISNLSLQKFRQAIGEPVYSRIKENAIAFDCDWEDYRINHKKLLANNLTNVSK